MYKHNLTKDVTGRGGTWCFLQRVEAEFKVTPLNFHKEQFNTVLSTQVCVVSLTGIWIFYDKFVACQVESVTTEVKQMLHVTSSQDEADTEAKQPVTSKNNSRFVITG